MGTIVTAYLSSFSHLKSKLLISCKLSLPFMPIFCYMGHTMSQIRIYLLSFVSGIKPGLFTLLVICRLNWKSQTSFTLPFSKTIPCSHRSLYHTVSFRIDLCSFALGTQVVHASVATAFSNFDVSLLQAVWIYLFSDFDIQHATHSPPSLYTSRIDPNSLANLYTSRIGFDFLPPSSLFRDSLSQLACFPSICFDLSCLLTISPNSLSSPLLNLQTLIEYG